MVTISRAENTKYRVYCTADTKFKFHKMIIKS